MSVAWVNVDSLGHVRYDAGIVVLIRGLKRSECASIACVIRTYP